MLRQKEQRDEQLDSLHLEPLITIRHSASLSEDTFFSRLEVADIMTLCP